MELKDFTKQELIDQLKSVKTKEKFFDSVSNIAYFSTDINRVIVDWNNSCEALYGYAQEKAIGSKIEELIVPTYQRDTFISEFNSRVSIYGEEVEYLSSTGSHIRSFVNSLFIDDKYYHLSFSPSKVQHSNRIKDLTDYSQISLENQTELVTVALDKNGYITDFNLLAQKVFGYSKDEVIGRNFIELFVPKSYKEILLTQIQNSFAKKSIKIKSEFPVTFKNFDKKIIHWDQMFIKDYRSKENYILMMSDYSTIERSIDQKLEYFANYDTLTDLPNRNLLQNRMVSAINRSAREDQNLVTMFINLDSFKSINHTLGYNTGDALLKEVAIRLHSQLRDSDTVARFSGDEFVILFENVKDELAAGTIAKRVNRLFEKPFFVDDNEISLKVNIGISFFPSDGNDTKTILNCANMAMLRAKENSNSSFQFFKAKMHEDITKRVQLEKDLKTALKNGEFFVEYQPQVDSKSGNIVSVEALVRWTHPTLKAIPPLDFIPVAEDSGLINEIGYLVLETAIKDMKYLHDKGFDYLKVAVNISGIQLLQSPLIKDIDRILDENRFDPNFLELELTESVLVSNIDRAVDVLKSFRNRGISIAIDDFGTGYSSLSYLKKLPVNVLKIDQSFIKNVDSDVDDQVIVNTIISMAKNFNFLVVAEGVETIEQSNYLRQKECDILQGYLFSSSLNIKNLYKLLSNDAINDSGKNNKIDYEFIETLEKYTKPLHRTI